MTELDRLSSSDALFLDVESDVNAMYVAACLIFETGPLQTDEGELDFERIFDFIRDGVSHHERYSQRIGHTPIERRPVWMNVPNIQVRHHVRRVRVDPGSGYAGLKRLTARFAAEPLDRNRPLWAIRVVDGFDRDRFALLVKVHHCLADGVSGIQLTQSLLSAQPTQHPPRRAVPSRRRSPRWNELLLGEISERLQRSRGLVTRLVRSAREPIATAEKLTHQTLSLARAWSTQMKPASATPLELANSPDRCLDSMKTELTRISDIRSRQGGTLNDVVVATVSLALGRFFESQGISRRQQKAMELRVAVPVDTRDAATPSAPGNHISLIFAKVPVGEEDPLTVLDQSRESLAAAKEANAAASLSSILDLAEWTPRFLTRRLTRWVMAAHPANFVLTNVHGPNRTLYLLESRLLEVVPVVPLLPGQALAIAVLSYAGTLYWGFHGDQAHFDDLGDWTKNTSDAFEELYAAAMRA